MLLEKLTGLDSRQKLADRSGSPIQGVYPARNGSTRVCFCEGWHKAGVNLNLVRREEHEDRRATVVPKGSMEAGDLRSVNSFYLFEVDERSVLSAQNSIEFQQI